MLLTVPQVLNPEQLAAVRHERDGAGEAWVDGRVTAGYQGAPVKFNQQIDERSDVGRVLGHLIISVLKRNPSFISAALPARVYQPMFNRYSEGMTFGAQADGSVRIDPLSGMKIRTDVSATLFLTDPADYDGGELCIEDTYGTHEIKLAAGDMVIYLATSVHLVKPTTRGVRVGCFFWMQSLIRDDGQRALLFNMDNAIQALNAEEADEKARRTLIGSYHNLLRMWSET